MVLLFDIFGFTSLLLSGVVRTAQRLIVFLAFVAVPLDQGAALARRPVQRMHMFCLTALTLLLYREI